MAIYINNLTKNKFFNFKDVINLKTNNIELYNAILNVLKSINKSIFWFDFGKNLFFEFFVRGPRPSPFCQPLDRRQTPDCFCVGDTALAWYVPVQSPVR